MGGREGCLTPSQPSPARGEGVPILAETSAVAIMGQDQPSGRVNTRLRDMGDCVALLGIDILQSVFEVGLRAGFGEANSLL